MIGLDKLFYEIYNEYEFSRQNLLLERSNLKLATEMMRLRIIEVLSICTTASEKEKHDLFHIYNLLKDSIDARIHTESEDFNCNSSILEIQKILSGKTSL